MFECQNLSMTSQVRNPSSDVARRIVRLRHALEGTDHGSQSRMAARVGVSASLWNNAERGLPVSNRLENKIMDRIPGMSIDWLRRGRLDGLSVKLAQLLGEVERKGKTSQGCKCEVSSI